MNAAASRALGEREASMYALGYPYAAWVVRLDALGLLPVCALTYFREEPSREAMRALFGRRFLHLSAVAPAGGTGDPTAG